MEKETQQLAKAFFNLANAEKYIDALTANKTWMSQPVRQRLRMWRDKLRWVKQEIYLSLEPGTSQMLREEIESFETLGLDACIDELVMMTEEQRATAEGLLKAIRKGEIIVEEQTNGV